MNDEILHWASDQYWIRALDAYHELRNDGQDSIHIDLRTLEESLFNGDGPAYKLMDAMCSVKELEGHEGFRGAPRLVLALLSILNEQCSNHRGL